MKRSGRDSRLAPAIGLFFLSPWVGEFLLGSSPVQHLAAALVLLAPLYGGGALLIREIARRSGRGYPSIVMLGAAYGVIEAGLLDQSMFNPAFLDEGSETDFATMANNALGYVIGHAIWSISVPIAMIELTARDQGAVPWLGRKGLATAAILYLLGCGIVFSFIYAEYHFVAGPAQLAGAAAAALLSIVLAFAAGRVAAGEAKPVGADAGCGDAGIEVDDAGGAAAGAAGDDEGGITVGVARRAAEGGDVSVDVSGASDGSSPIRTGGRSLGSVGGVRPWMVGIGAFLVSSGFVARPESGWIGLSVGCVLPAAAWMVVRSWSRRPWWSVRHRLALVSGTLLTYAWLGFFVTYLLRPEDRIAWFGNALFAIIAIALVAVMARRTRAADDGIRRSAAVRRGESTDVGC